MSRFAEYRHLIEIAELPSRSEALSTCQRLGPGDWEKIKAIRATNKKNAKERAKMRKIAIVDIETSGFQVQGGLIVEIGIVGLDLETGEVTNEFDAIVRESAFGERHSQKPFGWVFENSDLKFDDVMKAEDLTTLLPEIQAILDKFPLGATAYNKKFDFGFLCDRGLKIKDLPCIMLAATPVVNMPSRSGYSNPKWPKVEEAWEFFFPEVKYKEEHRALDDARHEALIALELYILGKYEV